MGILLDDKLKFYASANKTLRIMEITLETLDAAPNTLQTQN